MNNTDVFNEYDMVVSMTQRTINDQLTHLLKIGLIQPEFIVVQEIEDQNFVYKVLDSRDQIPLDNQGNPLYAYIDGAIQPQIDISESGTSLVFVLNFSSGTAYFWVGEGPLASLQKYNMAGWSYGVRISLDLKAVEQNDIGKNIKVPDLVEKQLTHFMSDMFSVNYLFMDFESTDLVEFDPTHTNTPGAGDVGLKQLAEFMDFYLKYLVSTGNPYILGYAINTTDQSQIPPDQNVPDSLKPVGTTFTLYHDPLVPDLNNLNFVLVTKGGHGHIAGSPGTFDTNWIGPNEQCDAKMIYSHSCLLEQFILMPFFNQLSSTVYASIKDNVSVSQGNDYASAKKATSDGFAYEISNVTTGDDQYVNTFSVAIQNTGTQLNLNLTGHLYVYKQVNKDMGFCTATAYASGTIDWSGSVSITSSKDTKGEPTLEVDKNFTTTNSSNDSNQNTCAEAFDWIGKILGGILDSLISFVDGGELLKIFDTIFDLQIPGIGNISVVFGNLQNAIQNVIILPAGQVFYFKNPASDLEADLELELTYESQN